MMQRLRPVVARLAAARPPVRVLSTETATAQAQFLPEKYIKHRSMMLFEGDKEPWKVHDAYVAPNCSIVGDVWINCAASVWYGSVIRGDLNSVRIGFETSIGENCVITTKETLDSGFPAVCDIRAHVSIGAGSSLVSCTVMDNCKIGERCVILEGALVESGAVLGPGSVVPPGRRIPAGQHWAGNPVKYVGEVEDQDNVPFCTKHKMAAWLHYNEWLPTNTVYEHAIEKGIAEEFEDPVN